MVFGYVDYKRKVAGIHVEALHPTGDVDQDMVTISEFYRTITPKNPDQFALDERYADKLS